jgi:hypothetical protein
MFMSTITSANHSCSVVVQLYQCSLSFIPFCNFLNKTAEIIEIIQLKAKHMVKLNLLTDKSLTNIPRNQLTLINGVWLYLDYLDTGVQSPSNRLLQHVHICSAVQNSAGSTPEIYCHVLVTGHRVWIDNWISWTLTTCNYK